MKTAGHVKVAVEMTVDYPRTSGSWAFVVTINWDTQKTERRRLMFGAQALVHFILISFKKN